MAMGGYYQKVPRPISKPNLLLETFLACLTCLLALVGEDLKREGLLYCTVTLNRTKHLFQE